MFLNHRERGVTQRNAINNYLLLCVTLRPLWFKNVLLFLLCYVVSLNLCACTNVFYLPSKHEFMTPQEIGVPYEDVWIEDEDEPKLHAWFLPAENPIATVLHLHGNAENISTHFASVYWMPAKGISVFTLDYRGYGKSEGEVSIEGIHRDVERAFHYLKKRTPQNSKFLIFGQSLGGAMALYSAAQPSMRENIDLVVAESPFSGYRKIAQEKLASLWLSYPFQWLAWILIKDEYSPIRAAEQISPTPVILIHATKDDTVPYHHSELLRKKIGNSCQLWPIESALHTSAFREAVHRDRFVSAIKDILSR